MSQTDQNAPINRAEALTLWVEKHGLEAVHAASGFRGKRTIKQYLAQMGGENHRNISWEVYHKLWDALGDPHAV